MKRKKLPVTIFTEREVPIEELKKLFPKMKKLHFKSEKEGREFANNIRFKNGKLSLKEGIIFTHPFKGGLSEVDIEFTYDSVGTFHTHPFSKKPELSVWDICDNFHTTKHRNLDCVSSSEGVACFRLKFDKDGLPSPAQKKMRNLCLLESGEKSWKHFYKHHNAIVEKIIEAKWKDV